MTKPAPAASPLTPSLAFLQKVWALNHALEKLSGRMAARLGITAQQRLIVRCIGRCPGISSGDLASLLHVDPGTVSASLRRLETKGLVSRTRDARDQRRVSLVLTTRGRALERSTPGTVENAVNRLLKTASPADLAGTVRVLAQLTECLARESR